MFGNKGNENDMQAPAATTAPARSTRLSAVLNCGSLGISLVLGLAGVARSRLPARRGIRLPPAAAGR